MELIEVHSEILSNHEVLSTLKSYPSKKQTNLATIIYEATSYLESSPAVTYSDTALAEFLNKLRDNKYDLTRIEKVQLVNLKPQNETELHLIIDNIEDRFTDEQRLELLSLIKDTLNLNTNKDKKKKTT
jgi:DNA-directed RNA polymerase subunit F